MATPEGTIKGKLDRRLKKLSHFTPLFVYSPNAGPYGSAGIPDRVAIVRGRFVGIECKASASSKLTALQAKTRDQILAAGGAYFVVYDDKTIDDVIAFFATEILKDACATGQESNHP